MKKLLKNLQRLFYLQNFYYQILNRVPNLNLKSLDNNMILLYIFYLTIPLKRDFTSARVKGTFLETLLQKPQDFLLLLFILCFYFSR